MPTLPRTTIEKILDLVGVPHQPRGSVQNSSRRAKRQTSAGSGPTPTVSSIQSSGSQYPNLGPNATTTTLGTMITTSSLPTAEVDTAQGSPPNADEPGLDNSDIKTITFSAIGGVLGLLCLSIIIYRLLRRHKEKSRTKDTTHDAFWEKWRWGIYSPVHGDVVYANHHDPPTATATATIPPGAQGNLAGKGSSGSSSWWHKLGLSGVLGVGGKKESTKKRHRAKTLYKVKRLKRGGTFEIDSTTDLTSKTTR